MAACDPAGTGTLPAQTYSSAGTVKIACDGVTDGLTLTVGPSATIGTEAGPVSGNGIDIDGTDTAVSGAGSRSASGSVDSPGDKDITVVNSGKIYTTGGGTGINISRDGAGLLKVEHKAGAGITAKGLGADGINADYYGKEGAKNEGIHIVSAGDIDVSGNDCNGETPENRCYGILASSGFSDEPLTTNPITVEVTGTVNAENANNKQSTGVLMNQFGSGTLTFTNSGTIKASQSGLVVYARLTTPVKITNSGTIEAGVSGIWVQTEIIAGNKHKGDTTVTATEGSMISADYGGISVNHQDGAGNIAVTHGGTIEAGNRGEGEGGFDNFSLSGIYVRHAGTGNITVTATKDSVITTDLEDGIWARITDSDSKGTVTVVNSGSIDSVRHGIDARNLGTGPSLSRFPRARRSRQGKTAFMPPAPRPTPPGCGRRRCSSAARSRAAAGVPPACTWSRAARSSSGRRPMWARNPARRSRRMTRVTW